MTLFTLVLGCEFEESQPALQYPEVNAALMARVDLNGDGTVGADEYQRLAFPDEPMAPYDTDGDGVLSAIEVEAAFLSTDPVALQQHGKGEAVQNQGHLISLVINGVATLPQVPGFVASGPLVPAVRGSTDEQSLVSGRWPAPVAPEPERSFSFPQVMKLKGFEITTWQAEGCPDPAPVIESLSLHSRLMGTMVVDPNTCPDWSERSVAFWEAVTPMMASPGLAVFRTEVGAMGQIAFRADVPLPLTVQTPDLPVTMLAALGLRRPQSMHGLNVLSEKQTQRPTLTLMDQRLEVALGGDTLVLRFDQGRWVSETEQLTPLEKYARSFLSGVSRRWTAHKHEQAVVLSGL